jgi:hypothetical protein
VQIILSAGVPSGGLSESAGHIPIGEGAFDLHNYLLHIGRVE